MTLVLLAILVIAAILTMFNHTKVAVVIVILSIGGCFGYRLFSGEGVRAIAADALFVLALIPIALYGAKEFMKIQDNKG